MTDFGKILDEWDGIQAASCGDIHKRTADFSKMLDRYLPPGEIDISRPSSPVNRRHPRYWKIDAKLDLHGMIVAEAESALQDFFTHALSREYRKVLIIHGKGNHGKAKPVLQGVVRRFLDSHPRAGMRGMPPKKAGGGGALWVALK